jgi:carotenoid 1,2-hydratase
MSQPVNSDHQNPRNAGTGVPPAFDLPVPQDGYRWWYLDAVSDDGRFGVVIILFVGSVFSPYYYRARQRRAGDPESYCAINVALYGPGGRWAMTERQGASVRRTGREFVVGPSTVSWNGEYLNYRIRERCTPFAQALRGEISVVPGAACDLAVDLDGRGRHLWTPWSPHARVQVRLDAPDWNWDGAAYLDANSGDEPLEQAFHSWDWSRTERPGATRLHYEVQRRSGEDRLFAFDVNQQGEVSAAPADPVEPQRRTGWALQRYPRCGHRIAGAKSYEDTPFYSRTLLRGEQPGELTVHERLSMDRFVKPWVRTLLPFRMPRELARR